MSYGQHDVSKQELIQLHRLLDEIDSYLSREVDGYEPNLQDYRDFGVRHTSFHRTSSEHRKAVLSLVEGIVEGIEDELEPDKGNPGTNLGNNYPG